MREVAKYSYPNWTDQQIEEYCFEAKQKDLLNDPKHMKEQRLKNIRKIDSKFGILSLTSKHLNYLMWSHYGNSHRGFCIGFDSQALDDTIGGTMERVVYQQEIPKMDLFGGISEFFVKQLSTKSNVWEYEEEYRIVKADGSKTTIQFDKNIIKHIVLGYKMKHEEKLQIIEFASSEKIQCIISELKLNLETFKLDESIIYQ